MLQFRKHLVKFYSSNIPKSFFSKEVFDYRRNDHYPQIPQSFVNCLVLHPIIYPNKGPTKELYLAEEAIGLAKALNWRVVKGPYWRAEQINQSSISDISNDQQDESTSSDLEEAIEEDTSQSTKKEKLNKAAESVDPSYVVDGRGDHKEIVFGVNDNEDDNGDLYDEWKNELLRASIAKSSFIKIKQNSKTWFFGTGKVAELGEFIRDNKIDAIFINHELNSLQIRNLEAKWNKIINFEDDVVPESGSSEKEQNRDTFQEDLDNNNNNQKNSKKRIKVFDRFSIILQIFAKRAQSRVAKLQIELAFLNFLKTKLVREGTTFSGGHNIFSGDLMHADEIQLEVVSNKQRGGLGKLSGQGETQLEIERRSISDREAKIKRDLLSETNTRKKIRTKRKATINTIPTIALIGYTNAGKSALMNKLTKAGVESENKLFQTLDTTSKKLKLQSGQLGILLDTIGFITNLPHDLIESFKSTLEEVADADIVLHIRDISHPNTEDQKETVLEVLRELQFEEDFYTKKMIEVWNKIDLIEEPIDYIKIARSDVQIIPISATYGTNCDKLVDVITNKVNQIMGKKIFQLETSPETHSERLRWLYSNGNIGQIEKFSFDDRPSKNFPYGKISFEVYLDDITFRRYESTFESKEGIKERDKVPDDWIKNSKSFFDKRKEESNKKVASERKRDRKEGEEDSREK